MIVWLLLASSLVGRVYSQYTTPNDGDSVKCDSDTVTYHYWINNRRVYTTDAIAQSWDPAWNTSFKVVNCTQYPLVSEALPLRAKTYDAARVAYLNMYPDVTSDPWTHFFTNGSSAGRIWPGPILNGYSVKCLTTDATVYFY
jgi:hypothetical protein